MEAPDAAQSLVPGERIMPCEKQPWPRRQVACGACESMTTHYVFWIPKRIAYEPEGGTYFICYDCVKELVTAAAEQDRFGPVMGPMDWKRMHGIEE